MEFLVIYLSKSAGLLALFYLAYSFLLKNDTSFKTNRIFLFVGLLTAFILPSLEFTRTIIVENPGSLFPFQDFANATTAPSGSSGSFDWWQIAGVVYLFGLAILSIQFGLQVFSLYNIIGQEKATKGGSFLFISTTSNIQPFSFFKYIVYNPSMHSKEDLELILEHEKVHAQQWHSADVLISTVAAGLLWFFPLVWLYKKAMVQNLEFLADKETVTKTASKKAYQQALVKVCLGGYQPTLTNPFYQSLIKKRIIMLNKTSNTANNFWKTTLIIPFLVIFIFGFQVKTEAQTEKENSFVFQDIIVAVEADSINASQFENSNKMVFRTVKERPLVVIDGKTQLESYEFRNINALNIKSMHVLKGISAIEKYGEKGKHGAVEITTLEAGEPTSETIQGTAPKQGKGFTYAADKIQIMQSKEEKGSSIKIIGVGNATFNSEFDGPRPLYVIDGKLMDEDYNPEEMNVENIKDIVVLKGSTATEKYGDKAANGVVEIYLKK